eukprot:5704204-Pyramimonas_sp.AAC.1
MLSRAHSGRGRRKRGLGDPVGPLPVDVSLGRVPQLSEGGDQGAQLVHAIGAVRGSARRLGGCSQPA